MTVLQAILKRAKTVAGGRDFHLIAVSKNQTPEKILALYQEGQRDFGENYAQEFEEKAQFFLDQKITDIRWHFIGHLQSNKIKKILPLIHSLHSLDNLPLAKKLNESLKTISKKLDIFIEVNVDGETSKSGVPLQKVSVLVQQMRSFEHLNILGLMGMPNPKKNPVTAFQELKKMSAQLGSLTQAQLSMGMSGDFETALQEGATHIRVGTALFGKRS